MVIHSGDHDTVYVGVWFVLFGGISGSFGSSSENAFQPCVLNVAESSSSECSGPCGEGRHLRSSPVVRWRRDGLWASRQCIPKGEALSTRHHQVGGKHHILSGNWSLTPNTGSYMLFQSLTTYNSGLRIEPGLLWHIMWNEALKWYGVKQFVALHTLIFIWYYPSNIKKIKR
jgi:hypothetical protein